MMESNHLESLVQDLTYKILDCCFSQDQLLVRKFLISEIVNLFKVVIKLYPKVNLKKYIVKLKPYEETSNLSQIHSPNDVSVIIRAIQK